MKNRTIPNVKPKDRTKVRYFEHIGKIVSVIFSNNNKIKEVTAYTLSKERIMYAIFTPHTVNPDMYYVRKMYLNPSNVTAIKLHKNQINLCSGMMKTEKEFIDFLLESDEETKRCIENGA